MSSSTDPKLGLSQDPTPDDTMLSGFHDAIKAALHSPLRQNQNSENAEHCFRAILPIVRRAGISRLADLTGLDRIGLPVVQAVRPAALSEVTSLGRGLSIMEAAVGATMESLERFYAEAIPTERLVLATANDLQIADGLFENLLATDCRSDWRRMAILWIRGIDVATGAEQPIPVELVHTCYTDPPPPYDGLFIRTTTGLACHTTASGALVHGLFECIERDAIARAFTTHGFFDRMRMDAFGLGKSVDHIMSLACVRGISFGLWHAPSPAKIPVVWCQAIEAGPGEPILALPTEGYAAALSIEAAASSAMLEALSARAGAISGARDDQTRDHYRDGTDVVVTNARQLILDATPPEGRMAIESFAALTLAGLIDEIVAAGLGPVLAVPLGSYGEPCAQTAVHCVRTILPGARPFSILR